MTDRLTSTLKHNSPAAKMRIAVVGCGAIVEQQHLPSLIRLAQALPSFVAIRNTAIPSHKAFRESWLIVDKTAYMRIRMPSRYEGYYELDNKLTCRDMLDEFHDIWEASTPDPNARRLGI